MIPNRFFGFQLLEGVLLTQVQIAAGGGGSGSEDTIINLANELCRKIPESYDIDEISKMYPVQYFNSMNTVLKQVK